MLLLKNIINLILIYKLGHISCASSNEEITETTSEDFSQTEQTFSTTEKEINRTGILILNAGTMLMPFSVYNVKFPVWEVRPEEFCDDNGFRYKPFKNSTKVLQLLKQKGFHLYAVLNVQVWEGDWSVYFNLPRKDGIEKIFEIFGWKKLFEDIILHENRIDWAIEKIRWLTESMFENMIYLDNNKKYDKIVVNEFHMPRFIAKKGLSYPFVKKALEKYYQTCLNKSFSI